MLNSLRYRKKSPLRYSSEVVGIAARVLAALALLCEVGGCSLLFEAPNAELNDADCELPGDLLMRASFDDPSAGLNFATSETPSQAVVGLALAPEESPCGPGVTMQIGDDPPDQIEVQHIPEFELAAATLRVVFRSPEGGSVGQQALFDKDGSNQNPGDISLDLVSDDTDGFRAVFRLQDSSGAGGDGLFLCSRPLESGIYEARAYVGGGQAAALVLRRWNDSGWENFGDAEATDEIRVFGTGRTCGLEAARMSDPGFDETKSLEENRQYLSIGKHGYRGDQELFTGILFDFSLHSSRPAP